MRKNVPFQISGRQVTAIRYALPAFCFLFFLFVSESFAQTQLLKDVNTHSETIYNEYAQLKPAVGIMYINSRGRELWKTTGSAGGTVRVKAFNSLGGITTIGSIAYFVADDGKSGLELWKSNGTFSGTVLVKDINPGITNTEIESLVAVGNTLYFVAKDALGKELWKSNGTASGTTIVKDIYPKGASSNPSSLAAMGGKLYFSANNGTQGYELWVSNGSAAGTYVVKDIRPEVRVSSQPQHLTAVNNTLYFTANLAATGRELWKSDGTSAGTVLVEDIRAGTGSSGIDNLTDVNGVLLFSASDGISGAELWKSNGTSAGTVIVKDMTPGPSGSHGTEYAGEKIGQFKNIDGVLYYTAYEKGVFKIWRSNGTTAGTISLQRLQRFGWSYMPPAFTMMNGAAYFLNTSPEGQYFLWKVPTGSTTPLPIKSFSIPQDEFGFGYDFQQMMASFNGSLYFLGLIDNDYKLYKSNGTASGTILFKDIFHTTQTSDPYPFATLNGSTFFTAMLSHAEDGGDNSSLWRTDGTPAGTVKLFASNWTIPLGKTSTHVIFTTYTNYTNFWKTDGTVAGTVMIDDNIFGRPLFDGISVNNRVYATNNLGITGGELWTTDGTKEGTRKLTEQQVIVEFYNAGNFLLYMVHNLQLEERELWRSDGTVAGTFKVKTIGPLPWRSTWAKQDDALLNGVLYFLANDGVHGAEVWRSDGTAAGTYMFADLNTLDNNTMGSYDFDIASVGVHDNNLYISALQDNGVWALFVTNGTNTPSKITDVYPVSNMIGSNGKLFLFATNSHTYPQAITNVINLWATDGTASGTIKLSDQRITQNVNYKLSDDVLYYTSDFYYYSTDTPALYRSDGTVCGTFKVNTSVPVQGPLELVNNKLVFPAAALGVGIEPHAYNLLAAPTSPCETSVGETSMTSTETIEAENFKAWPNPFTNEFSIELLDGKEVGEVQVFTSSGFPVENVVFGNTPIKNFGQSWQPGMYIIKVQSGGKVTTHMVVKK